MDRTNDPSEKDPEIQIEIPTRRGPEPSQPITSAALHGVEHETKLMEDDAPAERGDREPEKNVCLAFLDWYLYPYKNVLYCLRCTLFHLLNWLFMLKMFIYACVYIPLDLGLIVLACSGLLLFYLCFEYQILMSWLDVAMSYYLVEDDAEMLSSGRPKLGYRSLPECGDCPNRIKSVMTSAATYKAMIYYLIFKPVVVWVTSCCLIILIVEGGLLSLWIIVAAHPEWFKWTNNGQPREMSLGHAIGILFGGIFLLPFVLYIVIWAAKASKVVTYFFLTNVYTFKSAEETRLLAQTHDADRARVTGGGLTEV